jgi:bifunctional non-homologous end joining protein LigD
MASEPDMPRLVEPMLARPSTMPADESQWAFEVKWDGVRAIARSAPGRLRLLTRKGNDVMDAYPELAALSDALGERAAMLDGEIVAFDEHGRPSFQALQLRIHLRGETAVNRVAAVTPVTYMIFDLLWLDDESLMNLPYTERRASLEALELDGPNWHLSTYYEGEGSALFVATREQGLEGIVAKRLDSPYMPGRSGYWLKIKHSKSQELVIGGWTAGKGGRSEHLGALELGVYDEDGGLRYAGRVGTGFNAAELDRLSGLLASLARKDSPFSGAQPAQGAHFVEPRLVCDVDFAEWTKDGHLRHPSYKGLREDRDASEVKRERVAPRSQIPTLARQASQRAWRP